MYICPIENCTGCMACFNVCPHNAITFKKGQLGECLPDIDKTSCVECGICQKICPQNNPPEFFGTKKVFAAWSEDAEDITECSSGGAATVFSRSIIASGGVVYGAAVIGDKAKHIRVDELKDIKKLRGSKYVQSEIGDIYKFVKKDLKEDKQVLFIGVPCQVAGLKAYLNKDYDKLLTVDLICHGTPPHTYLEEHLDSKVKEWDFYTFRGKLDFKMAAYKDDKLVYINDKSYDEYFISFLDGLTFRNSCYSCLYAKSERISDVTIGDFWGINKKTLGKKPIGRISLVLSNTDKGESFLETLNGILYMEERNLKEAINESQGNLIHPTKYHSERQQFEENYKKYGFERAIRKTSLWKKGAKNRVINTVKGKLPVKLIRAIKKFF